VELTAREKADLAYKQRVYELALERKQALEAVVDDGYRMPTNYGEGALHSNCCSCLLMCWRIARLHIVSLCTVCAGPALLAVLT
jgi:hypothetical protein